MYVSVDQYTGLPADLRPRWVIWDARRCVRVSDVFWADSDSATYGRIRRPLVIIDNERVEVETIQANRVSIYPEKFQIIIDELRELEPSAETAELAE